MSVQLCDYGCGNVATYYFEYSKKWCCEKYSSQCPKIREKNRLGHLPDNLSNPIITNELCDYGCDKQAKFKIKGSKKLCCSKTPSSCSHMKHINWYAHRTTLEELTKKFPLFSKIEELRENYKGEIEVKCKQCERWFKPNKEQLRSRICHVEHEDGNGGSYLYCSDICKEKCPSYNIKYATLVNDEYLYNTSEYKDWKIEVFKRQKLEIGLNECEICGNKNLDQLIPHHEKPISTHPHLALDPDNAIILCGIKSIDKCHSKIHKKECSSYELNLKKCRKEIKDVK